MRLRYFDSGEDRSAIVFANGLGGPVSAFRPHMLRLGATYRTLSWDYRGLYASSLPAHHVSLSIPAHAGDVLAVADAAGIEKFTFVGWSMGVQIGLELYRKAPERLDALVLINGTAGRPLRGLPLPLAEAWLTPLMPRLRPLHRIGNRVADWASQRRETSRWLHRLRLVAVEIDAEHLRAMLDEFKTLPFDRYLELLGELCTHDATDVLGDIRVPTLLVGGGKDRLTPLSASRAMAERIPRSELLVLRDGTHYAAAEYPELLAERIDEFLQRRVGCGAPPPSARPRFRGEQLGSR